MSFLLFFLKDEINIEINYNIYDNYDLKYISK